MRAFWIVCALAMACATPAMGGDFRFVLGDTSRSLFLDIQTYPKGKTVFDAVAYTVNEPPREGWATVERIKVRVDCGKNTLTEVEVTPLDEDLKPLAARPRELEIHSLGYDTGVCRPPPPIIVGGIVDQIARATSVDHAIDIVRSWMSQMRGEPSGYRPDFLPRVEVSLPAGPLRLVSSSASGAYFVDQDRTRRTADGFEVMALMVRLPDNEGTLSYLWKYAVLRETVDCKARTTFAGPSAVFTSEGVLVKEYSQDRHYRGVHSPPDGDVADDRIKAVCDAPVPPEGAIVVGYEQAGELISHPDRWQQLVIDYRR